MSQFKPRIIAFCCNWCSYAGADLAGVSRMQYPANIRDIRVMCSARVELSIMLEALIRGADGVAILGCHIGDCHYIHGNHYTIRKVRTIQKLLQMGGVNPERVYLDWVSAAEAARFAQVVTDFTDKIRSLGPIGEAEGRPALELKRNLQGARVAADGERLRWLVGREYTLEINPNAFGEQMTEEKLWEIINKTAEDEYLRGRILVELKEEGDLSCRELAGRLGVEPAEVLKHLVVLRRKGLTDVSGLKERSPVYECKAGGLL